ncbi:MAG: DUF370 domain-containing protein [Tissierellia bacterium]|nr:DUF370 domain-containing protein [Tissierellia bacterium]
MINIGFGNIVSIDRIIAVIGSESAPVKRMISEARGRGLLIDATFGRKTRSVIICDTNQLVLASIQPETIAGRINGQASLDME